MNFSNHSGPKIPRPFGHYLLIPYRVWTFWGVQGFSCRAELDIREHGAKRAAAAIPFAHRYVCIPARDKGYGLTVVQGYIPGAEALSAVQKLAQKLKDAKPSLLYLLDRTRSLSIYPKPRC